MQWLIIILVVLVAIAPLTHFMPTKRQRVVAGLREQAAVAGLFVTYQKLPMVPGKVAEAAKNRTALAEGTLYYGVRWLGSARERPAPRVWLRGDDGWHDLRRRAVELPSLFRDLPASVQAFSCDADSAGVYWREQGDSRDVEAICNALLALRDGSPRELLGGNESP